MFGQSGLIFSADEAAQKTRYEGKSARIFEKAGTNFARHPGSKKLLLTTGPPSRAQVLRSWRAAPSQPVRTTRSLACAPMHPVYIEYTVPSTQCVATRRRRCRVQKLRATCSVRLCNVGCARVCVQNRVSPAQKRAKRGEKWRFSTMFTKCKSFRLTFA